MNRYSVICRLMAGQDDWRTCIRNRGIDIKEAGKLAIFNYDMTCDFRDPVVQEARGIIIDTDRLEVVCWPFRKFGNYGEYYTDDIDWETARVQEKIDGSIVKLWYNQDRWQWSTNSMIDAAQAHVMERQISFLDLIRRADNYRVIPMDRLNRDNTYIFELVAPENQIVIRYEFPSLYHIGTRSNRTGQEICEDIGIRKPREYALHSLSECLRAAEKLNLSHNDGHILYEGFVVVDDNWHRMKIKSPEYVYAHRLALCRVYTKKRILPVIRGDANTVEEMIRTSPDSEVYIRYYQWRYAELKKRVRIAVAKARAMYGELEQDRKAMAEILRKEPLQRFCFKALGNDRCADDIMAEMKDGMIGKLIEDYDTAVMENHTSDHEPSVT